MSGAQVCVSAVGACMGACLGAPRVPAVAARGDARPTWARPTQVSSWPRCSRSGVALAACARPPTLASLEIHVREKPHKQKRARSRFLSEASNPQTAPPKLKASSVHLRLTHTTLPTAHGPVGARRLDRRQRSTQQSTDECVRTTAHIYEGKALVAPACELRKAPSGVGQLPHPSQ